MFKKVLNLVWVVSVMTLLSLNSSLPAQSCVDIPVPETACTTSAEQTLTVSGLGNNLGTNVIIYQVEVIVSHTDMRDINLYLRAPNGTEIELSTENGGFANGYGISNTCPASPCIFADWAAVPVTSGTSSSNVFLGPFRPEQSLAAFNGINPNGVWTLRVCDVESATPSGSIKYFNMQFDESSCIGNAALSRVYVNGATVGGTNDGSSWTNAFTDLQDAFDAAKVCTQIQEVWVAMGTYKPGRDLSGNDNPADPADKSFYMTSDLRVYGGFIGGEMMLSERNPDLYLTILSGDIDNNDSNNPANSLSDINGTNAKNIMHIEGVSPAGMLDGFTFSAGGDMQSGFGGAINNYISSIDIRHCRFVANCADEGGAVYNSSKINSDSKPNFTDCIFENNQAFDTGGAIRIRAQTAGDFSSVFTNCTFLNNSCNPDGLDIAFGFAASGGAISAVAQANADLNFIFQDCLFENNDSGEYGGAMYCHVSDGGRSDFTINNTVFQNNTARRAGAIWNGQSTNGNSNPRYTNCIFSGNMATEAGGVMYNITSYGTASGFSYVDITNCTFYNNTAPDASSLYLSTSSLSFAGGNIENSIFWNNTASDTNVDIYVGSSFNNTIAYSLLQTSTCPGNTTCEDGMLLNQDPMFVSSTDLHLQPGSPAIDAGTSSGAPDDDLDGNPRPTPGTADDMGAYEAPAPPDMVPPMISCPTEVNAFADAGLCTTVVNNIAATASDNETANPAITYETTGASTLSGTGDLSGTVFAVGTTTVTYTATDDAGNTATCSFDITVTDSEMPTISCPADINTTTDPEQSTAVITFTDPSGNDNCGVQSVSSMPASGSTFDVGTTPVTYTVVDVNGNTNTCTFNVTVSDGEAPTIECPATVMADNDAGACNAVVTYAAPIANDNIGIANVTCSPESGSTFMVGTTEVTCTATDTDGNTASCSFDVIVADAEAPEITCPITQSVNVDGANCYAVVNDISAVATDNCGTPGVSLMTTGSTNLTGSDASGGEFNVGTTTVTYTATDGAGGTATCSFDITVTDNTACGCGNPQPGDSCDDGDAGTINDTVQGDCSCLGDIPCDIELVSVDVVDETCAGDEDGSITITATCTTCDGILYSINGAAGPFQSGNTFTGLVPDNYEPYVKDSGDDTCEDGTIETVETGQASPDVPVADVSEKAFCANPDLQPNLANTGVSVANTLNANEKVVWVLSSAPSGSAYSTGDEFTSDDCSGGFADYGELAVANSSQVIRVNDMSIVPVGTYTFDAYIENCATGCVSALSGPFTITISELPDVDITADPNGDICQGTTGVQYNATISSTDGGTYSYAWCAYNSGDSSGSCFNGFDDNTIQNPVRDWTSSNGMKSVGVTVSSDVLGCTTGDLYSFLVVAPTFLSCPADLTATLITDPQTFDCAATASWNHPEVTPGPCDPQTLSMSIDGAAPEVVTPGESYTSSFTELGMHTITYTLEDGAGSTISCSFMVTVDGLPCGFADTGGVGCSGNIAGFDGSSFTLTANDCATDYPYNSDQVAFVFNELCGDGEIVAHVTNVEGTGFAGVMMRDSEDPAAPMVALGTNAINRVRKEVRTLPGYPAFPQSVLAYDQFWVRIIRTGNQFMASASTDGVSWVPYVSQQIMMSNTCIRVGIYTYSEKPGNPITATFDNVLVTEYGGGALAGLPGTTLKGEQIEVGEAFRVYPNPTSGSLRLDLHNYVGMQISLQVVDNLGRPVQQLQFEELEVSVQTLDLSDLAPGVYQLILKAGEHFYTQRVVLQR